MNTRSLSKQGIVVLCLVALLTSNPALGDSRWSDNCRELLKKQFRLASQGKFSLRGMAIATAGVAVLLTFGIPKVQEHRYREQVRDLHMGTFAFGPHRDPVELAREAFSLNDRFAPIDIRDDVAKLKGWYFRYLPLAERAKLLSNWNADHLDGLPQIIWDKQGSWSEAERDSAAAQASMIFARRLQLFAPGPGQPLRPEFILAANLLHQIPVSLWDSEATEVFETQRQSFLTAASTLDYYFIGESNTALPELKLKLGAGVITHAALLGNEREQTIVQSMVELINASRPDNEGKARRSEVIFTELSRPFNYAEYYRLPKLNPDSFLLAITEQHLSLLPEEDRKSLIYNAINFFQNRQFVAKETPSLHAWTQLAKHTQSSPQALEEFGDLYWWYFYRGQTETALDIGNWCTVAPAWQPPLDTHWDAGRVLDAFKRSRAFWGSAEAANHLRQFRTHVQNSKLSHTDTPEARTALQELMTEIELLLP